MIDSRKCAVVPMMNNETLEVEFELLIYGRTAEELMTVPNDVISSLAVRFPNHKSSPFALRNLRKPPLESQSQRYARLVAKNSKFGKLGARFRQEFEAGIPVRGVRPK